MDRYSANSGVAGVASTQPTGAILITGGAGFIGSHFQEEYPDAPFVVADFNGKALQPGNPRQILADVRDQAAMRKIFETHSFSAILHLAAAHKDFGVEQEEYFTTNVTGTEILCRLASEFGVKQIVFYSSVAVYGEREEPTTDETEPKPTNDYGASKLQAEQVLRQWYEADPTRLLLIVRPALVYGERNVANMYRLIDQIAKGRYFNVGAGANIKSIAYVKNLVQATWFLLHSLRQGVFIFNYSDQPHLKTAEIGGIIAEALGKPQPRNVPKGLLLFMAAPFDLLIKLTGKDLPISSMRVKKYGTQTFHKAGLVFQHGFKPRFSTKDGLCRMVAWYQQQQNGENASN